MKNIKNIFALLLVAVLSFTMAIPAFAAVAPTGATAVAGETVVITFSYDNIAALEGTFYFTDSSMFSAISVDVVGQEEEYNPANGLLTFFNASPIDCVIELTLTVASTATVGQVCDILFEYETTVDGTLPSVPAYQIDTARVTVKKAPIVLHINYDYLIKQIERADALNEDEYTADSWAAMKEAYDAGKALLFVALTQGQVDRATAKLEAAIDALVKKTQPPVIVPIDYTALKAEIDRAEALTEDDYTAESWAAMESVLAEAKALVDNAETQKEVDDATAALKAAIDALVKKEEPPVIVPIDYTALKAEIERAEALTEDDYTAESWAAMEAVLAEAKALVDNAETQKEVDDATAALKAAIDALVKKEEPPVIVPVDYTELNEQIAIAEGLKKSDYTAESWADLEEALEVAIAARESDDQAVVDAAAGALKVAIANLVKASVPELGGATAIIYAVLLMAAAVVGTVLVIRSRKKISAR